MKSSLAPLWLPFIVATFVIGDLPARYVFSTAVPAAHDHAPASLPQALPPKAPPKKWRGLIGEYGDAQSSFNLFEADESLFVQRMGLPPEKLTQKSRNFFEVPGSSAPRQFKFHRHHGQADNVTVDGTVFERLILAPESGKQFKITPLHPIEELRTQALAATPPPPSPGLHQPDLVELIKLDSRIHLDIRYATSNNFMSSPMYLQARAFMQRPAAEALLRAHLDVASDGYGLLIHDAYRPWYVTRMFWDATPDDKKIFVADPQEGSKHNRGCAVDLSLYELRTGKPVEMTGGDDEMSRRSFAEYPGGTSRQRWYRQLLRQVMEKQGFISNPKEWWHFDYRDWREYPVMNVTFEKL